MRDSMIFYRSFFEAIKELPPENKIEVYDTIFSYSLDFSEPNLSGISKTIFTLIKPQLDANIKRFENGKKSKNKQKGSETQANEKQNISKNETNNNNNLNYNLNPNENNILLEKESNSQEFTEPIYEHSLNPIRAQFKEKNVAPKKEKEQLPEMPEDFKPLWNEWKQYRKDRKKKPYAALKWEQMAVDKLIKLSENKPELARRILNQTYENNYESFFPLKQENYAKPLNKISDKVSGTAEILSGIRYTEFT